MKNVNQYYHKNSDIIAYEKTINDKGYWEERTYDENGNLNDLGKKAVASYVLNNWINGVQFNEIFLPDVAGKDRVKRAKGLRSPGYSFKGVQFEPIYFKDDLDQNGNEVDDSGMYILREDAERIQDAFGDVMPVGKGYKLLHAGMESMNPKWAGKNFFNKGYTTILDEEYVQNNPRLAGLYDAMKARREKYIKDLGPIVQALTSGNPTYMALAVSMSSNKIKGSNGELNVPSQFENDGAFTLDDYKQKKKAIPILTRHGTLNVPLIVFADENLDEYAAIWSETNPDWKLEIERILIRE